MRGPARSLRSRKLRLPDLARRDLPFDMVQGTRRLAARLARFAKGAVGFFTAVLIAAALICRLA